MDYDGLFLQPFLLFHTLSIETRCEKHNLYRCYLREETALELCVSVMAMGQGRWDWETDETKSGGHKTLLLHIYASLCPPRAFRPLLRAFLLKRHALLYRRFWD